MPKEAKVEEGPSSSKAAGDLIRIIVTLDNGEVNAVEIANDTDVIALRNAINAIFKLDGPADELVVRSPNAAVEPLKNPREILASAVKRDATSGDWEVYVEVPAEAKGGSQGFIDYRDLFVKLLRRNRIFNQANPTDVSFRLLETIYLARFQYMARSNNPQGAAELYREVLDYPKPSTRSALLKDAKLHVGLPLDNRETASLLCANSVEGEPKVIKQLRTDSQAEREIGCCMQLKLDEMNLDSRECLVPTYVQSVHIRDDDNTDRRRRSIRFLVMPRFLYTLGKPVQCLGADFLISQTKRMINALNTVHSAKLVHMDVKADNIFIWADGKWYLGDFGSCVAVGTPIKGHTKEWYWERLRMDETRAEYRFDWGMLAVCVVIQARVKPDKYGELPSFQEFKSLMSCKTGTDLVDLKKIEEAIALISSELSAELGGLLLRILRCGDQFFE